MVFCGFGFEKQRSKYVYFFISSHIYTNTHKYAMIKVAEKEILAKRGDFCAK
jgi:hypothetical protein